MADPLSIGLIASGVGSVVNAVGSIASGNAKADAEKYNAAQAEANAKIIEQQAAEQEAKVRMIGRQTLGSMRASYGASGVTMDGSPMDVYAQSAANNEMDALSVKRAGEMKAKMYREDARMGRQTAAYAETSGYLGAAGALLDGAGKYAGTLKRSG